jgi:hypothetical protein
MIIFTKWWPTISAASIDEGCAQVNKSSNPRLGCASREMHRSLRVDGVVNVGRMFLARVMNPRRQMNDCINTD